MNIECIRVGYLQENCYILDINNNVLVIDPGDEGNKIIDKIGNRKVLGILITHEHFDHIGAIDDLVNKYNCNVYKYNNLNIGENIIGDFRFDVLYMPGHRDDLVCYYFKKDNIMFVGDFIFEGGIGRTDLEYGNNEEMKDSIDKILKYKEDIIIYPGHGNKTSLDRERDNLNFYKITL